MLISITMEGIEYRVLSLWSLHECCPYTVWCCRKYFGEVARVQRYKTKGGLAPTSRRARVGATKKSAYTCLYSFYIAAKKQWSLILCAPVTVSEKLISVNLTLFHAISKLQMFCSFTCHFAYLRHVECKILYFSCVKFCACGVYFYFSCVKFQTLSYSFLPYSTRSWIIFH